MTQILILSDLHAYRPSEKTAREPSFLIASSKDNPTNPIRAIPEILKDEGLAVDWVLCPGDIADQADPDAQTFAWQELAELKKAVKAKLLLSTAGNHDVDSRLKFSTFDPKGHLQSLSPPFPGLKNVADKYWARNYHIHELDSVRLVNLNSAAFHGFHTEDQGSPSEYRHGRVSNRTIQAIIEEIKQQDFRTNILFTHHHPYRNSAIYEYEDDYSEMQLGGKLVAALTDTTASSWLIIHGHQHYPQVTYGPHEAFPPLIFSAGSISAKITSPLSAEAPNQFYHVTVEKDISKTNGWWPCGTIRAWSWVNRREWQATPDGQNIPGRLGFGCRDNVTSLANPRITISLMRPLVKRYFGSSKTIPFEDQAALVEETIAKYVSLLSTIPVVDPDNNIQNMSIIDLMEVVGGFFAQDVNGSVFKPEPLLTFRVDNSVPKEYVDAIGAAMNQGAFIMLLDESGLFDHGSIKDSRLRFSYLLCPLYHLPLTIGGQVNLSRILSTRRPRSSRRALTQDDLFNRASP